MSNTGTLLQIYLDHVKSIAKTSEKNRISARAVLLHTLSEIETPFEQLHNINFAGPSLASVLKICIDIRLFELWEQDGGDESSVVRLAALTKSDPVLLARLLKHLASMNTLVETNKDTYKLTPFTRSMARPGIPNGVNFLYNSINPITSHLPQYLAAKNYQNPIDSADTNWNMLNGSTTSWFESLQADTSRSSDFSHFIQMYSMLAGNWTNHYPTEKLLENYDPTRPLLVDAGGGKGADLAFFREKHKELPKQSLILQELPSVVQQISLQDEAIHVMTHDLLCVQPVVGARCYFTHSVFHSWPNEQTLDVLSNFAQAMQKGYSTLLLHEKVIPPTKAARYATSSDIIMMATFSAHERTHSEWEVLLSRVGLKLMHIYVSPLTPEGIIEAELA